MNKDLLELADDIATDPTVKWEQITEQNDFLYRRQKYHADGYRNGVWFRVVFEPHKRGILTIFPLNDKSVTHTDEYTEKVIALIQNLNEYLTQDDVESIEKFLQYGESKLAFEILCDILVESRPTLHAADVQKIKALATEMSVTPSSSWEFLLVLDEITQEPKYVLEEEGVELCKIICASLLYILSELQSQLTRENFKNIENDLVAGEDEIAADELIARLIDDKLKISRQAFLKFKEISRYCLNYPFPDEKEFSIVD
jgi:hypothetical protein